MSSVLINVLMQALKKTSKNFSKISSGISIYNTETSAAEILNEKILKILKLFQKMTYIKKIPTDLHPDSSRNPLYN